MIDEQVKLRKDLINALENSPHKTIYDPEVDKDGVYVISADYEKLVDIIMPIIGLYLRELK